jgi:hypothetical protein
VVGEARAQPVTVPFELLRPVIAGGAKRNIGRVPGVASLSNPDRDAHSHGNEGKRKEGTMATTRENHQIVETPTEARQAEPGPSVLALLTVSTGLAVLILGVVWFAFFRT